MNTIEITVRPNSSKSAIVDDKDKGIVVFVKSAPDSGKANQETIKLLSKKYGSSVRIIKGKTSRKKTIRID